MASILNINRDQSSGVFKTQRELKQFEALAQNLENANAQIAQLNTDLASAQAQLNSILNDLNNLTLDSLSNVSVPSPSDNNLLEFDTASNQWVAASSINIVSITVTGLANVTGSVNAGSVNATGAVSGQVVDTTGNLISSDIDLTDGVGIATATLNTAPVSGEPTKWVPIDDNGTTRYLPAW